MARHRAIDLLGERKRGPGFCLCEDCRPATIMKRTHVCFDCRTTQRRSISTTVELDGDRPRSLSKAVAPVCTTCSGAMVPLPLLYSAAVPRRTNDRAWALLKRSLQRPVADRESFSGSKKVSNRRQRRQNGTSRARALVTMANFEKAQKAEALKRTRERARRKAFP